MANPASGPIACALAAALLAGCASAPDKPDPPQARGNPFKACQGRAPGDADVLDETAKTLETTVCGASLWFDGLFGQRDLKAARTAHGRFEVSTANSEFEGEETRVRFDARVQLPALERRLSAFIGRDNEGDVARDRSEGLGLRSQAQEFNQDEDWFAGLGYRIRETWGVRSEFRVGVRDLGHPTAFVQLRNTLVAYEDDDNQVTVRLTPFTNTVDGAGVTTGFDYDHALAPTRLLRWGNIGTYAEETPGTVWRSAVLLYQSLADYRAIALETFVRGASAAPEPLYEYGVRTIYREPFFRHRLFAELVVGYSWPRVDPALEREGSFGVTFGLELPFGKEATPSAPERLP
ncbi:MAG: hypothetical protein ACT4PK_07270 [Gammaproteobacteria bacterium]